MWVSGINILPDLDPAAIIAIDSSGIKIIKNLAQYINLEKLVLDLSYNNLKDIDAQYLAQELGKLTNLQQLILNLAFDNLQDVVYQYLSQALGNLTNLKYFYLDLSYNNLDENNKDLNRLTSRFPDIFWY